MQSPTLTVKVSRSLQEINLKEWHDVFPSTPEEYFFFKTIEETLGQQFKFYYVSIYENSRIVCLAPCFIADYSLDTTTGGLSKILTSWAKKWAPRLFTIRVLICGSPIGTGRLGVSDPPRLTMAQSLVDTLRSIAKQEHIQFLAFKDFSEHDAPFFHFILSMGFHKVTNYPAAYLDIRFHSFEEYLASLSSATRKGLRRKFKKIDGHIHFTMEVRSAPGDLLDRVYQLYLNTREKSEVHFELATKEFFRQIAINMPQETKYFLWSLDGRLVAFDLCVVSGSTLADKYLGMDYEVAYKYHLYYVTFRDILSWCMHNGIRTCSSGTLNYDPKKRLDFTFAPQHIYVQHMNGAINSMLGLFVPVLKPENFDPILKSLTRHP